MPRVTGPSFHCKGLCGLVRRGSQGDSSPLTMAQLSPAGLTQCLLPSCEVLGKWLIKCESQGQGGYLRWSAACALLLAVSISRRWASLVGSTCWLALPSFPRKLSLPEQVFCKGWDSDLMETPALLSQPPMSCPSLAAVGTPGCNLQPPHPLVFLRLPVTLFLHWCSQAEARMKQDLQLHLNSR